MSDRAAAGPPRGVVVIASDCAVMRQRLDPTAWLVLEELVLTASAMSDAPALVTATSVRTLASGLGLSKDTVAAALRRLALAGVVRREDERDGGSGRFGHSHYVVDLPATGMRLAASADDLPARTTDMALAELDHLPAATGVDEARRTRPRPRARHAASDAQLSLLDPDQNPARPPTSPTNPTTR